MNPGEQGIKGPGVVGQEAENENKRAGGDDARVVLDDDRKDASSSDLPEKGHWYDVFTQPGQLRTVATHCPLMAAILAPLATLLDIPALTVSFGVRRQGLQ